MSPRTAAGRAWLSAVAFLCVVALLVVAALAFAMSRPSATRYSAMLTSAVGLYPGNSVRVLGVSVGRVLAVTPLGRQVRVDFEVNNGVKVPSDVRAAIVVPTVIADRYLQLAPAYGGGPTLPAGAVIPVERTAVPAEFDDLLTSVQKLSSALGPQGVNQTGALADALHVLAQNVNGNGQRLNTTLGNTADAINTLAANRENLAGTIRNLQSFTTNLNRNDAQIRAFTQQFAQVSGYLAGERHDLAEALRELSIALGEVAKFIRDNKSELRTDVDQLSDILATVNGERLSLEQALDGAQSGLDGLVNAYNASSGTLDTRPALLNVIVCTIFGALAQFPAAQATITQLAPLLDKFLPGVLAGCVNSPGTTPPGQALASLGKAPASLGQVAGQPATPAQPPADAPARVDGQPDAPAATGQRQPENQPEQQPEKPKWPSLGSLFGGGR